jgi:spore photoproduct lyase
MKKVKTTQRKDMQIKPSGRSTDYIPPSFAFGCGFNCTYCYCKRHVPDGVNYYSNIDQILTEIDHHAMFATDDKPNQTDDEFITYDIGCNTDIGLHAYKLPISKIFKFFKEHPRAKASFATKIGYTGYLFSAMIADSWSYGIPSLKNHNKVRIRMSLMPQKYSSILEPNTASIIDRIHAIDKYIQDGFEVHINYSPVIVTDTWHQDYLELFNLVDKLVVNKDQVKCEVIFLTHNTMKHYHNQGQGLPGEDMLWRPDIQEPKKSQYGGTNIRYKHTLKAQYVNEFRSLHNLIIPWNTIRYIF